MNCSVSPYVEPMFTVWRCYLSKNLEIYSTSSFDRRWKTVSNKKETRRAVGDNYAYSDLDL